MPLHSDELYLKLVAKVDRAPSPPDEHGGFRSPLGSRSGDHPSRLLGPPDEYLRPWVPSAHIIEEARPSADVVIMGMRIHHIDTTRYSIADDLISGIRDARHGSVGSVGARGIWKVHKGETGALFEHEGEVEVVVVGPDAWSVQLERETLWIHAGYCGVWGERERVAWPVVV